MKKIHFELLLAWALVIAPLSMGLTAEGVVLEQAPLGATNESIMTALRQSLTKQRWNVLSDSEADSIVAERSDSDTRAKVEFTRFNQSIRYNEIEVTRDFVSSAFSPGSTGNRVPTAVKSSVPKRWLNNLHDDIFSSLTAQRKADAAQPTIQPAAPKAVDSSKSAKARLEELKELLETKLISESEYEQKRQQILSEL